MIKMGGLRVELGEFVLGAIDLHIAEGEYFVLLGPTGAGKSVLLETICGLIKPKRGEIFVNGSEISGAAMHKRGLGVVLQEPCLFSHKRVFDNIAYALRIARMRRREIILRVEAIAEEVGVGRLLRQWPANLSGGERQRVALGRTLAGGAKCLLLDEPLSAIDASGRAAMRQLLKSLQRKHELTVLHVTHDFEEALALADRIGLMNGGRVVEIGDPEALLSRPGTHFAAQFFGQGNVLIGDIVQSNGVSVFVTKHNKYVLPPQRTSGAAYVMIGSEQIVLSRERLTSSARNCIAGRVNNIVPAAGGTARVEVDAGDVLAVTLLKRTVTEMAIKTGEKVFLAFKSSAVHVIDHCSERP